MDTDTVVITVNPYVPPSSDTVTITKAEYNTGKRELKVEATSTASADVVLRLVEYRETPMDYNPRKDKYTKVVKDVPNPDWITVSSDDM